MFLLFIIIGSVFCLEFTFEIKGLGQRCFTDHVRNNTLVNGKVYGDDEHFRLMVRIPGQPTITGTVYSHKGHGCIKYGFMGEYDSDYSICVYNNHVDKRKFKMIYLKGLDANDITKQPQYEDLMKTQELNQKLKQFASTVYSGNKRLVRAELEREYELSVLETGLWFSLQAIAFILILGCICQLGQSTYFQDHEKQS